MIDETKIIKEMLDEIIAEFTRDFIKSPYDFTHERDIHGQFYHRILSNKNNFLLNMPDQPYPLLHLEYPHDNPAKRSRGRLDLVILKPDNTFKLSSDSGDYNKGLKKMFALEFEFNDTGKKAVDHFNNDTKKLADCGGASTYLFIFIRDKTFTTDGDKHKPIYFEKLIEKEYPFNAENFPDKIYYVNAQPKIKPSQTKIATFEHVKIITQDTREIEILEGKNQRIIDYQ